MSSLRSLTSAFLVAALLALAGCGGGSENPTAATPPTATPTPAPVELDSARTARATVGPAGGTVAATSADGRRYTLTVQPGALATAIEITATPVVSMGSAPLAAGLKGAVRFGPAGLRFALPATLRIEGASTVASSGTNLVGFVRSGDGTSMQFVPPVVVAGALQMEVRHFSDTGVSQATAEQLAQIPIDAAAEPADALVDEAMRSINPALPEALLAAEVIRLHDTRVAPRLTLAEFPILSTPAERTQAVSLAQTWLTLVGTYFDFNLADGALPGQLPRVVTALRQRVLDLLTEEFEAGRTACMAPAPIGIAQLEGLEAALRARQAVLGFRFIGGLPGLDADTAGRRLNDCVRVVFVPRPIPTFEVGRQVSLDARAQLIFAADANASIPVPFEFKLSSNDATIASPTGFSDAEGNYTSVVTPRDAEAEFRMKACMVVSPRNGGPVGSLLCGQQVLRSGPTGVVFEGDLEITTAEGLSLAARLEEITGSLTIKSVPSGLGFDNFTNVSLPNLKRVGRRLTVINAVSVQLPALESVGAGSLELGSGDIFVGKEFTRTDLLLTTFEVPALTQARSITIDGNPALATLAIGPVRVAQDFNIFRNGFPSFDRFSSGIVVGRRLQIVFNTGFSNQAASSFISRVTFLEGGFGTFEQNTGP